MKEVGKGTGLGMAVWAYRGNEPQRHRGTQR